MNRAEIYFKEYFEISKNKNLTQFDIHNMDDLYTCMDEYLKVRIDELVKNSDIVDESERHEQGLTPNVNNLPVSGFSFRMGANYVKMVIRTNK